jgi:DNA replication regulator SLD3
VAASSDLSSFYRDAILPVKKMDLKYKETLPTIIRNVALVLSDDEADSRPKKRRSKKKTLGKNGLYAEEEDLVRKWWKARHLTESVGFTEMTREEEAKRHVSELRLRETQLQILLILETIYLETTGSRISGEVPQEHICQEGGAKRPKSKKPQDLNVLLELLLDRLCIWHTVSADDTVVPDTAKETGENHLSGKKIESDMLRDFCTEVIIPFYASRLPEQCKLIKRKLGGPNLVSPTRPTPHSKSSSQTQPGAVAKRPQPQKSRRTLQRVLTDEKTAASQRGRHPSLARSVTAPSLQEVKRESVEPSLPSLSASVRGGIQIARRADNREVDLNAVAKQHETKLKKMNMLMEQKRELDAAISALRKPNRGLVAKEIAEHAEKRISSTSTSTSSRKSRNPVRNPFWQGVQVMATPKGSRKKDVSVELPAPPRGLARASSGPQVDTSPALGSDISMVPGSALRPSVPGPNVGSRDELNSIHETPSRGLSRLSDPLEMMIKEATDTPRNSECSRALFKVPNLPVPRSVDGYGTSSITVSSRLFSGSRNKDTIPSVQETPPRSVPAMLPSSPGPLDTPVKGGNRAPMTPGKSIYEQLGWDDDELAL